MATKDTEHKSSPCGFDKLLERNIPHILDKIFMSLDQTSFNMCLEVCQAWKDLLTSEYFHRKKVGVWLDTNNLRHQVYSKRIPGLWVTNGEEVAYMGYQMKRMLHFLCYITREGVAKYFVLPRDRMSATKMLWLLDDAILVLERGSEDRLFFIDKNLMEPTSIVEFPECDDFPRFHFKESTKGVSFSATCRYPPDSIILGEISKQHRCKWRAKLDEDYVTDEAGCCYSVRVNIPDNFEARQWVRDSCFNNTGSHFILHSTPYRYNAPGSSYHEEINDDRFSRKTYVYKLEGDKTRVLWYSDVVENVRANSQLIFMWHQRWQNSRITVKDLQAGSEVTTIHLDDSSLGYEHASFAPATFTDMIATEDYFVALLYSRHHTHELNQQIVVLKLSTLGTKWISLECTKQHKHKIKSLHGDKLIAILCADNRNHRHGENCSSHGFLDLTEENMDNMFKQQSIVTSQMPSKGINYDFISFGYCRQICTGIWMIWLSRYVIDQVNSDFAEDVYSRIEHFIEIISWKPEELKPAMQKFMSIENGGDV